MSSTPLAEPSAHAGLLLPVRPRRPSISRRVLTVYGVSSILECDPCDRCSKHAGFGHQVGLAFGLARLVHGLARMSLGAFELPRLP